MYDRGLSVLEQYGLEAKMIYRGRGCLVCETQAGPVSVWEFDGSLQKLEKQAKLLTQAALHTLIKLDVILKNQEDQYVSYDKDHIGYYIKQYYAGRECDTHSQDDILRSVRNLAKLHLVLHMPWEERYEKEALPDEYFRHNREMRKIQKHIRKKQQKQEFETRYLGNVEWFLEKGEEVVARLQGPGYEKLRSEACVNGQVCHGEYNQHNIVMLEDNDAVINLDKWCFDVQIADLYQFMRKILEKNNWDVRLGQQMLQEYDKYVPLSDEALEYLKLRFSYPEKFWKLANHYYVRKKSRISQKDLEKLEHIIAQKQSWQAFCLTFE